MERKTTASYWARLAALNCDESSVAVTAKSLAAPSAWIAAMPSSIESWRNPAVSENTSTFSSGSAPASSTVTVPVIVVGWTSQTNV